MYKNLLLALFAILFGVTTGMADNVMIDVDNAANVDVTYGYDGTALPLEDGMNRITTLTSADNPLTIRASAGAEIVSITKNNSEVLAPSGDGAYRVEIGNIMLSIVTSGGSADIPTYNTMFAVTGEAGKFTANYGDTSILIEDVTYPLPAQPITLRPVDGYQIADVDYNPMWTGNMAVNNGDGTWTFTPQWDGTKVDVTVIEKGITFTVDVNLPSNVSLVAWTDPDCNWEAEGTFKFLNLTGYGPYTAVAPMDIYALDFLPVEGGKINSITRLQANGEKTQLVNSAYVGWRSSLAEGDTFTINCEGPEVELTLSSEKEGISVDSYVVSVNGEMAPFTVENPVIKAHAGDIISIAGGKGTLLTSINSDCAYDLQGMGPVASFMIFQTGNVYIYGAEVTDMTINIDNADAVIIRDQNGMGKILELEDGENVMENVANPLTIQAAEGYLIKSVVLDGEILKPIADGSYKAAIEAGSTLIITTEVKPAAYPVTIALIGEFDWLNIAVDGDPHTLTAENNMLAVEPGSELTFSAVKGYLINSLTTTNNMLYAVYDEDNDIWSVTVNGPGNISIEMEKWVAGENAILLDYTLSSESLVSAIVTDENGKWVARFNQGLNEVEKGLYLEFSLSNYNDAKFTDVLYNGVAQTISEDGKLCRFQVTEEGTVSVTTATEFFVDVTGYSSSDPVNHAVIGNVFINKEGELHYKAKPGEKVTLLHIASPGYKFNGFSMVTPESVRPLISTTEPYEFIVPEGVEYVMVQAEFVRDEENPSYVVHTYLCYVNGLDNSFLSSSAFVRVETMDGSIETNDLLVCEGEQVRFLCYVQDETYKCINFCLFTDPQTVIPQIYTVNGEHANVEGVIEISAYVVTEDDAVESVDAESFRYDAASATLYAPEAGTVYTLGGQAVKGVEAGANDLSGLASGIYVVVTPAGTLKIAK